ncbi:MAG: pyruvate kinase [Candidatus Micrarchaeota archaeon]|nr:pyruvate kinase [Candidatus Micrarchaeota archaeon]
MKKTKIVCTVGPSSRDKRTLSEMREAGMDAVRINTAYGDISEFSQIVANVRSVAEIPIMLDVKGPEVRTVAKSPIEVKMGEVIEAGPDCALSFNEDIYGRVSPHDRIIISDGYLHFEVRGKRNGKLLLRAFSSGKLEGSKSVSVPRKVLSQTPLSEKDLKALDFARRKKIEFIALSITRSAEDVARVRRALGDAAAETEVLAKIESADGLRNIDGIIRAADGVIVARGGLGVDLSQEKVPLAQKEIIKRCNQAGKVSITATQMLESMITNPEPTRAETSDVANAILDGTDAVMLAAETTIGRYPARAVRAMSRIAREVENSVPNRVEMRGYANISDTVSRSIYDIAKGMPLASIVTITRSGYTARMISRFRVRQPIIAITESVRVRNKLQLVFGVKPLLAGSIPSAHIITRFAQCLHRMRLVNPDDTVLFTAGVRTTEKHSSNLIEIHRIRELLKYAEQLKDARIELH